MAFGPWMKMTLETGLCVELGPFDREDVAQYVDGMQRLDVMKYFGGTGAAFTLSSEQEWYDGIAKKSSEIYWGIWVDDGSGRRLVGATSIKDIGAQADTQRNMTQASTGILIANPTYWGRGVASAAHRARTWYAFRQYGLVRLKSAVAQPNTASRRALEKVGYIQTYVERNMLFVDGQYIHYDNFECLNPDEWAWRLWWGDDRPTRKSLEARKLTQTVLEWADEHVQLH
mgnify:CR=1 FL=1